MADAGKDDFPVYYAKSGNRVHGKIRNRDHLKRVGELARQFGQEIGKAEEAGLAGDFHDLGKNGVRFQSVLNGTMQKIDHAFSSAAFLYGVKQLAKGRGTQKWKNYEPILESIQGHHDGLRSLESLSEQFQETLSNKNADVCPSGKLPSLSGPEQFQEASRAFQADFPDYHFPKLKRREISSQAPVADMLDTRMLFSCLVDADYSVSASDDDPDYLRQNSSEKLDAAAALERLEAHLTVLRQNSTADPKVNEIRNRVYEACGWAGELPVGLYTLTAPTGVGKTMAMLHFALRHCITNGLRRIIVVLPFLTLAEQTEKEYRKIFSEILVDHSQRELKEDQRELAARWDAPVVITTSVRFFESLFSDSPRECRKLHSIAGSVVLFDEAQSLPAELAEPTVGAVRALCQKYNCTMVFSTATQPDFGALPGVVWDPVEILPNGGDLFHKMHRTQVQWRLSQKRTLEEIGQEMAEETNVCCIVNLRRHARSLFAELKKYIEDGAFLLTTDLCPGHRLEVVKEIMRRQKEGLPCYVVATQCIEAGVDLDFDKMYRALAPLESIIQAAGRCNRNGKMPGGGQVIVFELQDDGRAYPGESYAQAAMIVKGLWADNNELDIHSLSAIRDYYRRFFAAGKQKGDLQKALKEKSYPDVAKNYRLIDNAGVRLIVPWQEAQELFYKLSDAVSAGRATAAMLREAAPITISCFEEEAVRKCATPILFHHGAEQVDSGCYILNTGFESRYDSQMGFQAVVKLHEKFLV